MANLTGRDSRETSFGRRMAKLSVKHRKELARLLGDPPNPDNVPGEFWAKVERETEEQLALALLLIFMMGYRQHDPRATQDDAQREAERYVSQRARRVAQGFTRHSRELVGKIRDASAQEAAGKTRSIFGPERAEAIAVTETTAATSESGERAIIRTVGFAAGDLWRTEDDARVCPICRPLHKAERAVWGADFPEGPPAHPRCRCWIHYSNEVRGTLEFTDEPVPPPHRQLFFGESLMPEIKAAVGELLIEHLPGEHDQDKHGRRGVATRPKVAAWATRKFKDPAHAKAFVEWFGDSKVVDDDGEPLVVYHGTHGDLVFDEANRPVWMTDNPDIAEHYSGFNQQAVMPLYSQINNPLETRSADDIVRELSSAGWSDSKIEETREFLGGDSNSSWSWINDSEEVRKTLIGQGYDGVKVHDDWLNLDNDSPLAGEFGTSGTLQHQSWVIFSPSQIKSATGNRGTFDPDNPNITESLLFEHLPGEHDQDKHGRRGGSANPKVVAWAEKRFDNPEHAKAFVEWFGDSKAVDENGEPMVLYHGTRRPDRVGNVFDPERATSGPMAFFTDDPEIASKYASAKQDTSLERPTDYAEWFETEVRGKKRDIAKTWYALSSAEKSEIAEKLPHVTKMDSEGFDTDEYRLGNKDEYGVAGKEHWDWTTKQESRGNVLDAAKRIYLDSGTLFGREEEFLSVLKLGGMNTPVKFKDPDRSNPAIYAVHLAMKNPLDTSNIPDSVISAIEKSSFDAPPAESYGADAWDKDTRDPGEWVQSFKKTIGKNTHVWSSIPDFVTDALKGEGYDGIKDTGGKMGGKGHAVWIPFSSSQIKSSSGNRGTFDPDSPKITESLLFEHDDHDQKDHGNWATGIKRRRRDVDTLMGGKYGEEEFKVYTNPSRELVKSLADGSEWGVRGLEHPKTGDLYFWDAGMATHEMVFDDPYMGLDGNDFPNSGSERLGGGAGKSGMGLTSSEIDWVYDNRPGDEDTTESLLFEHQPGEHDQKKHGRRGDTDQGHSISVRHSPPDEVNPSFDEEVRFTTGGSVLHLARNPHSQTDWSIVTTFVPEEDRRQGIASAMIDLAKAELDGTIGAQASNDVSVRLFWDKGFRYGEGTLDDALASRKEWSSVNLIYDPADHPLDEDPNITESLLVEHQPGGHDQKKHGRRNPQLDTPEFKKWFGKSKVVDEDGEPLVVYHGTYREFGEFDNPHAEDLAGGWHMFSESPEYAGEFAAGKGGNIIPSYLNAENPLDLRELPARRGDVRRELLATLEEKGFDMEKLGKVIPYERDLFQHIHRKGARAELARQMKERGFDSIVMPDSKATVVDNKMEYIESLTWVVLNPTQIKSAIGNRGSFDPDNPNITESLLVEHQPGGHEQKKHGVRHATDKDGGGVGGAEPLPDELSKHTQQVVSDDKPSNSKIRNVVSETSFQDADTLISQGIRPSFKPDIGEVTTFQPGRGIDRNALYVADEKAFSRGSFGQVRIHVEAPPKTITVPTEQAQLGTEDIEFSLGTNDGGIIPVEVGSDKITKVEVWRGGSQWDTLTRDEYIKERGLSGIPRLPSVPEYEVVIKNRADQLFLSPEKVRDAVRNYNRATIQDKWFEVKDFQDSFGDFDITESVLTEHLPGGHDQKKHGRRNPQLDTPEFKKWFGDSKVVDDDGEPLVVYHGTTKDFEDFDLTRVGDNAINYGEGVYFTSDADSASDYTRRLEEIAASDDEYRKLSRQQDEAMGKWKANGLAPSDPLRSEVKAIIKNLSDRLRVLESDLSSGFPENARIVPAHLKMENPHVVDAKGGLHFNVNKKAIDEAKAKGADGVIIKNVVDNSTPGTQYPTDVYVIFRPTQIKSATGNKGAFDPNSPDITESTGRS